MMIYRNNYCLRVALARLHHFERSARASAMEARAAPRALIARHATLERAGQRACASLTRGHRADTPPAKQSHALAGARVHTLSGLTRVTSPNY